jgi:hypothetical protein
MSRYSDLEPQEIFCPSSRGQSQVKKNKKNTKFPVALQKMVNQYHGVAKTKSWRICVDLCRKLKIFATQGAPPVSATLAAD